MRTLNRKNEKNHVNSDPLLSRAAVFKLEKKLANLKKQRPQAAAEMRRLAEMGDFSENVEYQLAKRRLRGINNQILRLEDQLKNAVIIEDPPKDTGVVQIGHTVTLEVHGRQRTYQILGSAETNPSGGIISHRSPLGAALLGKAVGATVDIQQGDQRIRYTILRIK